MQFSAMTGIRCPKVDAWVQNQELYKQHGMAHPSLKKKSEVERRSRSPLVPGPRKTKSFEEELFEKYMAEKYPVMPERLIRLHFLDNQYIIKELFPCGFPAEVDGFWSAAVSNPRGRGTTIDTHKETIYPWHHKSPPADWRGVRDYLIRKDMYREAPTKGSEDADREVTGRQIRLLHLKS